MTDAFCIRELISLAARSTRMKNVMETEARSSVTEQTNTIRRMHERRAGTSIINSVVISMVNGWSQLRDEYLNGAQQLCF